MLRRLPLLLVLGLLSCKRAAAPAAPDGGKAARPAGEIIVPTATPPPAKPDAAPAFRADAAPPPVDAAPPEDAAEEEVRSTKSVTGAIVAVGDDGKPRATPDETTVTLTCIGPKPDEDNHWRVRCDSSLVARWRDRGHDRFAMAADVPGMDWAQVAGNGGTLELELLDVRDGAGLIVVTRAQREGDMSMKGSSGASYYLVRGGSLDKVFALDVSSLDVEGDMEAKGTQESTEVTAGKVKTKGLANLLARTSKQTLGEHGWAENGRRRLQTYVWDGKAYVLKP